MGYTEQDIMDAHVFMNEVMLENDRLSAAKEALRVKIEEKARLERRKKKTMATREEHMALEGMIQKLREKAEQLEVDAATVASMLVRLENELLEARPQ